MKKKQKQSSKNNGYMGPFKVKQYLKVVIFPLGQSVIVKIIINFFSTYIFTIAGCVYTVFSNILSE